MTERVVASLMQARQLVAQLSRSLDVIAEDLPASTEAEDLVRRVRRAIWERDVRGEVLGGNWFDDPAWDLLLELFLAEITGASVSVSGAAISMRVPVTTALRWIARLTQESVIERQADPKDSRRVRLTLTRVTSQRMRAYFEKVRVGPVSTEPGSVDAP